MHAKDHVETDVVAAGAVANAAEALRGLDFPASKADVVAHAERAGADDSVMDTLSYLPDDRRYDDPVQLFDAIGDEVRKLEAAARRSDEEEAPRGVRKLVDRLRGR